MLKIRLKELMEEYGTNINELSENTGINRRPLTQLAKNKSKMVKFETLDKILDFFGISYDELFIETVDRKIGFKLDKFDRERNTFIVNFSLWHDKRGNDQPDIFSIKIMFKAQFIKGPGLTLISGKVQYSNEVNEQERDQIFSFIEGVLTKFGVSFISEFVSRIMFQLFEDTTSENIAEHDLPDNAHLYNRSIFNNDLLNSITKDDGNSFSFVVDDIPLLNRSGSFVLSKNTDTPIDFYQIDSDRLVAIPKNYTNYNEKIQAHIMLRIENK